MQRGVRTPLWSGPAPQTPGRRRRSDPDSGGSVGTAPPPPGRTLTPAALGRHTFCRRRLLVGVWRQLSEDGAGSSPQITGPAPTCLSARQYRSEAGGRAREMAGLAEASARKTDGSGERRRRRNAPAGGGTDRHNGVIHYRGPKGGSRIGGARRLRRTGSAERKVIRRWVVLGRAEEAGRAGAAPGRTCRIKWRSSTRSGPPSAGTWPLTLPALYHSPHRATRTRGPEPGTSRAREDAPVSHGHAASGCRLRTHSAGFGGRRWPVLQEAAAAGAGRGAALFSGSTL